MESNSHPKKMLTKEQQAKQQRKILKDQRRKQFHDISIQGTNDYSIVSKRSVEKLYTDSQTIPHYFQHFVKKHARRSPAINRGYWTRMESIKRTSYEIIKKSVVKGGRCVVINLGAGYDPLAFQYLDEKNPNNSELKNLVSFVDVDFPDLNKIKIDMIRQSKELCRIIGEEEEEEEEEEQNKIQGVDLKTKNYTVLSCDLKNINLFIDQLQYLQLDDPQVTKIYIAEVSIAYMTPQHSDAVIKATSQFPNSHFLCLEQIMPSGISHPFARTMLYHFNKLNSPILSVEKYNTIPLQIQRFKEQGYQNGTIEAVDLWNFWKSLDHETKESISQVEAFDEWEEFIVFGMHYLILHASNVEMPLLQTIEMDQLDNVSIDEFDFEIIKSKEERKHHASTILSNGTIITNGGASISRLQTTITSTNPFKLSNENIPQARLSHTLTTVSDKEVLLIGGRTAPGKSLTEVWKCSQQVSDIWQWNQDKIPQLSTPRSRHSTFIDSKAIVYIVGGLAEGVNDSTIIRLLNDKWQFVDTDLPNLTSCSTAIIKKDEKEIGVIIGGMVSQKTGEISSTCYIFEIFSNGDFKITSKFKHPLMNRYGAHAEFINDDEILLIGGVSGLTLYNQNTTIIKISIKDMLVTPIRIDDGIWTDVPLLVGFQMVKKDEEIVCLNGGAVCYSFGSVWDDYLSIKKKTEKVKKTKELEFYLAEMAL